MPTCAMTMRHARVAVISVLIFYFLLFAALPLLCQSALVVREVNLRPQPSTKQPAIQAIPKNTQVDLMSPTPTKGFLHVRTQAGAEGWVWAENIKPITLQNPPHYRNNPQASASSLQFHVR